MNNNERKDAETQSREELQLIAPSRFGGLALHENEISRYIVECAIEAHRTLGGPGLLESVYEEALVWELNHRNLDVRRQVSLPIPYKGHILASPLR